MTGRSPSAFARDGRGARRLPLAASAKSPLPWLGALLALYLLLPLAGLAFELVGGHGAGFEAPGLGSALSVSLVTASCSTVICALLGIPLAYSLASRGGSIASLVGAAVLLPLALPPLMAGILLVSVIGPDTTLGQFFGGRLTDSMAGIVLAQIFVAAPFTIVAARSAFAAVDPTLLEVATTLGMRGWQRFSRVSLPVAARGIVAGLLLTWLRSFGEFGATIVVAYHPYSLPVFTYVRFAGFGLAQASAPTVLALASAFVVLTLVRLRLPRRHRAPVAQPAAPLPRAPVGAINFSLERALPSFQLSVTHHATSRHLAILGPSGAGKTTILRCLAGLAGQAGTVRLGTKVLSDLPAEQRQIGYVPQEPSLFPGRSTWQQLTLGADVVPGLAAYWVEQLGLRGLENRRPDELSGGQRHRVALARALCRAPQLLLLDEPFAALDAPLRSQLRRELRLLLRTSGFVSLLVSHDPEEAALLADEILVISDGRLLQAGPVSEVFAHPATPLVARILGIANIHEGRVSAAGFVETDRATLLTSGAALPPVGSKIFWSIRPERVSVSFDARRSLPYDAVVLDAADVGTTVEVRVAVGGTLELLVRLSTPAAPAAGTPCSVDIPAADLTVWRAADSPLTAHAQA